MTDVKTRREESVEATRAALIDSARDLFVAKGFAATSLDDVVSAARVTKGALYHHFPGGKQALFRAVFDLVDLELAERIAAALPTVGDGWDCVLKGLDAYLEACHEPVVRAILFREAPIALDAQEWQELETGCPSRELLRVALDVLLQTGEIGPHPLELLTRAVFSALDEAGGWIGDAEDPAQAHAEARQLLLALLRGIRT